jgi:hypothetical protein
MAILRAALERLFHGHGVASNEKARWLLHACTNERDLPSRGK